MAEDLRRRIPLLPHGVLLEPWEPDDERGAPRPVRAASRQRPPPSWRSWRVEPRQQDLHGDHAIGDATVRAALDALAPSRA